METRGILYGVGVGPGDPELLTIKALRLIREASVIAVPGKDKDATVAYRIVKPLAEGIEKKKILECEVPMTKDPDILERAYTEAVCKVTECLNEGENVVFLTLGDPTVYATYMYVHQKVAALGYSTEIVSGIPSFCAAAARLNISLAERAQMLHIIPSSYQIDEALAYPGTKVLMKAASRMREVKKQLMELDADVVMVENCGMENERIFRSAEEMDENAGYLSLIVVKEKENG